MMDGTIEIPSFTLLKLGVLPLGLGPCSAHREADLYRVYVRVQASRARAREAFMSINRTEEFKPEKNIREGLEGIMRTKKKITKIYSQQK